MRYLNALLEPILTFQFGSNYDVSSVPRCDMVRESSYAIGNWTRNDSCISTISDHLSFPLDDLRGQTCFDPESPLRKIKLESLCYDYRPSTCSIPDYSETDQITLLNDVCFVGDSLLGQLASAASFISNQSSNYLKAYLLVNYMTMEPMTPEQVQSCEDIEYSNIDAACQKSASHLNTAFNTTLCPPKSMVKRSQCHTSGLPFSLYQRALSSMTWTKELSNCSVLVFNTGHHFYKEDSRNYNLMATNVVRYLQKHFVSDTSKRVIYVSSPIGHNDPNRSTKPEAKIVTEEEDKYHWLDVVKEEGIWKKLFSKANKSSNLFYFLDISHMSLLRPDAHPPNDGLHYCPGVGSVPATWYKMLISMLHDVKR